MFFKRFYKTLKFITTFYSVVTALCLIYAFINLSFIDIIVLGAIFLFGILVGTVLIRFYGNAVTDYKLERDSIVLKNMKGHTFTESRNCCTEIINKPNRLVINFGDKSRYYICKYYFFNKRFFDLSAFNKNNFKNANIVK